MGKAPPGLDTRPRYRMEVALIPLWFLSPSFFLLVVTLVGLPNYAGIAEFITSEPVLTYIGSRPFVSVMTVIAGLATVVYQVNKTRHRANIAEWWSKLRWHIDGMLSEDPTTRYVHRQAADKLYDHLPSRPKKERKRLKKTAEALLADINIFYPHEKESEETDDELRP